MSTSITVVIYCDHRDGDGYCGSVFRRPGTVAEVRQEATGYGWQLGDPDLCPRHNSAAAEDAQVCP